MLVLLILATAPLWVRLLLWLFRRNNGARPSTSSRDSVSRNPRQTGPMWEQDRPFPECFTDERDDDL